tara:strand:- start:1668 stop:2051 length:384 start_codon:yes stop_codon:yes gene_type:complete
LSDTDTKKDFNQNYLADKLHSIGDKLGDAYGEPLLNELIARMERTVSHFNEEVDVMVKTLTSRTKNQRRLLASMRGEDPNLIDIELSELEKKLEAKDKSISNSSADSKEDEEPKKKMFSFFKKKKKK